MFNKEIKSVIDLLLAFPTEEACIVHFEKIRWNGNVISPFDATSKVYKTKRGYMCKNTQKNFNVKTNTMFDNTKMPLQKWFLAIFIATSHKKGISSLQLSRDLDITQKSAWFMLQRIRNCFDLKDNTQLANEVEIDESYFGGKERNKHAIKRNSDNFQLNKDVVFGALERQGKVYASVIERPTISELYPHIFKAIDKTATIYSDELTSYKSLKRVYDHQFIKHNRSQYVDGRIHTNTIEGFWSLMKRGIIGIYHFTSKKHLQKYVDEFVFRYNTRDLITEDRFNLLLSNMENRTTYKMLINEFR